MLLSTGAVCTKIESDKPLRGHSLSSGIRHSAKSTVHPSRAIKISALARHNSAIKVELETSCNRVAPLADKGGGASLIWSCCSMVQLIAAARSRQHVGSGTLEIAPSEISLLLSVCFNWTAEIVAGVSLCVPSASAGSTPAARIHSRNVLYSFSDISQ